MVITANELNQGGLAGAIVADDGDLLPRFNINVDVSENVFGGVWVAERNRGKFDTRTGFEDGEIRGTVWKGGSEIKYLFEFFNTSSHLIKVGETGINAGESGDGLVDKTDIEGNLTEGDETQDMAINDPESCGGF